MYAVFTIYPAMHLKQRPVEVWQKVELQRESQPAGFEALNVDGLNDERFVGFVVGFLNVGRTDGREVGLIEGCFVGFADVGRTDGSKVGLTEGCFEGFADILTDGRFEGMTDGRFEGLTEGRSEGFDIGFKVWLADTVAELTERPASLKMARMALRGAACTLCTIVLTWLAVTPNTLS